MEKLNFDYLLKNIPTPDGKVKDCDSQKRSRYLSKKCVGELPFFINNNKKDTEDHKQDFSYGLKSGRSPPQVKEHIQFKNNLVRIVKEVKFRKVKNNFQKILCEDMKQVQTLKKTLTNCRRQDIQYVQFK